MPDSPSQSPENPYQRPQQNGQGIALPFRDRKALILVMGILAIVAGLGVGCLGGLYGFAMPAYLAQAAEDVRSGVKLDLPWMRSAMAMVGLMMAFLAAALIWLGIGAVRMRRWAGRLFLAGGWLSAVVFGLAVIGMAASLPQTMEGMRQQIEQSPQGTGPDAMRLVQISMGVSLAAMVLFYLLPPLVVILVFRARSVRETLAHYDRRPSWTDGLALPVLVWWMWLAMSAVCTLSMAPVGGAMYQMMGLVQQGWHATVIMLGVSACAAGCAWTVMAKKPWSWYACMGFALVMGGLGWVATANMDLVELYRKMGVDESQLKLMSLYGGGATYKWMGLASIAVLLLFLLVTKRYYRFADAGDGGN